MKMITPPPAPGGPGPSFQELEKHLFSISKEII